MEDKKYSFDFLKEKLGEDKNINMDDLEQLMDSASNIMHIMYSSLRKSGFSRDEAIALVIGMFNTISSGKPNAQK